MAYDLSKFFQKECEDANLSKKELHGTLARYCKVF